MRFVAALDVGGTRIKSCLVAPDGTVEAPETSPTGAENGPEAVLAAIEAAATRLVARGEEAGRSLDAVGVAVPGIVDTRNGRAVAASNIGWRDAPVASRVSAATGLPSLLTHDVRAGGIAEGRLGAARGTANFLFVPVGTGVGGAAIIDGVALEGAHAAATELGHLRVPAGLPACRCGGDGCVETVASAAAIAARYRVAASLPAATAEDVVEAVRAGDQLAMSVWQDAVEGLADALLAAVTVLDPELIVVGGGLSAAGPSLLDPLEGALKRRMTFRHRVRLVRAQLGDRAGCLGAGLVAWDHVLEAEGTPR